MEVDHGHEVAGGGEGVGVPAPVPGATVPIQRGPLGRWLCACCFERRSRLGQSPVWYLLHRLARFGRLGQVRVAKRGLGHCLERVPPCLAETEGIRHPSTTVPRRLHIRLHFHTLAPCWQSELVVVAVALAVG